MARIDKFTLRSIQRPSEHAPIEATYAIIQVNGKTMLQIDSYGAADRQIPGKVSQSLQFSPEGIAGLRKILDQLG